MKGFKGVGAVRNATDNSKGLSRPTFVQKLVNIFCMNSLLDSSERVTYEQDDVELSIDDIEIDDIVPMSSSSTVSSTFGSTIKQNRADEEIKREKLLGIRGVAEKPRMRTLEEVVARYRKTGRASGATKYPIDKLVERKEKLERLDRCAAQLESEAQNFNARAHELLKTVKRRKWWQL